MKSVRSTKKKKQKSVFVVFTLANIRSMYWGITHLLMATVIARLNKAVLLQGVSTRLQVQKLKSALKSDCRVL